MKENNRGITLLVLSVTIIIILIITSTATYYSISAYNNARLAKFENELKIMQTQVELWEEEVKLDIGKEITEEQKEFLKGKISVPEEICEYYRYISVNTLKENCIDGIEQDYFVIIEIPTDILETTLRNILEYRIVAKEGLKYKGEVYYTLAQLQNDNLIASVYNAFPTKAVCSLTNKTTGYVNLYSNIQEAIKAAGSTPSTVTLLKDVEQTEAIEIGEEQNIDFNTNGKTLHIIAEPIINYGILKISGNGLITTNEIPTVILNAGQFTLSEATLQSTFNDTSDVYGVVTSYMYTEQNSFVIESGKIKGSYFGVTSIGGRLDINGGTIEMNGSGERVCWSIWDVL